MSSVIITGAGSGIGLATARRFARDGYRVVGVEREADGLTKLEAALDEAGGEGTALQGDVTDPSAAARAVQVARQQGAGLAVLVNNAGIGVAATLPETTEEDWQRIVDTNLTGMFHMCKAALPVMLAQGHGAVVNVASVAAVVGVASRAAYCASKAGVVGLTRAIAVDHAAEGIRANAICPGTVHTEWIDKILSTVDDPAGQRARMEARQLDGRMGTPEEVAAGIAFLASEEARFTNGTVFVMDGGMSAV